LTYHQIRNWRPTDGPAARRLITPPGVFAAQMDALDRSGYATISGTRLVNHLLAGVPLPPKPLLVTFDDASQGQYTSALPILRRHRFVATFFVMTVVLDKPGWLSRAQIRRLDRLGMTIAAHRWDHRPVPPTVVTIGGFSWSGPPGSSAVWSAIGCGCLPIRTAAGPGRHFRSWSGPGIWRRSSWPARWTREGRDGPSGASWSPRPGATGRS
jgi:hypothetical protein